MENQLSTPETVAQTERRGARGKKGEEEGGKQGRGAVEDKWMKPSARLLSERGATDDCGFGTALDSHLLGVARVRPPRRAAGRERPDGESKVEAEAEAVAEAEASAKAEAEATATRSESKGEPDRKNQEDRRRKNSWNETERIRRKSERVRGEREEARGRDGNRERRFEEARRCSPGGGASTPTVPKGAGTLQRHAAFALQQFSSNLFYSIRPLRSPYSTAS